LKSQVEGAGGGLDNLLLSMGISLRFLFDPAVCDSGNDWPISWLPTVPPVYQKLYDEDSLLLFFLLFP
jgi:hypothetical protein